MKAYGNVKGRTYHASQPIAEERDVVLCPICKRLMPRETFMEGGMPRKWCKECRVANKEKQDRTKAEKDWKTCNVCKKKKPPEEYVSDGKERKLCSHCRENGKIASRRAYARKKAKGKIMVIMRECSACGELKPVADFAVVDGILTDICTDCIGVSE